MMGTTFTTACLLHSCTTVLQAVLLEIGVPRMLLLATRHFVWQELHTKTEDYWIHLVTIVKANDKLLEEPPRLQQIQAVSDCRTGESVSTSGVACMYILAPACLTSPSSKPPRRFTCWNMSPPAAYSIAIPRYWSVKNTSLNWMMCGWSRWLWLMNSLATYFVILFPRSMNLMAQRSSVSRHLARTTKPKAPARRCKKLLQDFT